MWLSHHGILGQKWGVRRFQNKDGSMTSAGRKRYSVDYDEKGRQIIRDESGKKMSRSTHRYMEKQMVKQLKEGAKYGSKEDRAKLAEYNNAKRATKSSISYIGNNPYMAASVTAMNYATKPVRERGKQAVDKMVAEFANKHLDELSRGVSQESFKKIAKMAGQEFKKAQSDEYAKSKNIDILTGNKYFKEVDSIQKKAADRTTKALVEKYGQLSDHQKNLFLNSTKGKSWQYSNALRIKQEDEKKKRS